MKEINSSKISLCSNYPSEQIMVGQKLNMNQQKIIKSLNLQIQNLSIKNKLNSSSKIQFEENKKQQISPLKQLVNQRKKPEIQIKKLQNFLNKKQSSVLNLQKINSSNQTKANKTPMFFKKQKKIFTQQQDNKTNRLTFQSQNRQNNKQSSKFNKNINKTYYDYQIQNKKRLQKQQLKQNSKFYQIKKKFTNTQKYIQINKYKSTVDIVQKSNNQNSKNPTLRINKKRNCSILVFNNEDNNQNQIKQQNSTSRNMKQNNKKQAIPSFFIPKSSQFKSRKVQFMNFCQQNNTNPSTIQSSFTSKIMKNSQLSKSNSKSKSKSKLNTFIPSFIKQRQQKNQLLKKSSEKQKICEKSNIVDIKETEINKNQVKNNKKWSIKDFQIKERLGKGAFGDVYLARQNQIGFFCVLKKLSKKKIKQEKLEKQVIRQIKVQSFLNHPHLTKLYGFFDDDQFVYLILEYLTDGSLAQRYSRKKCSQKKTASFIRQICQGLKFMHIEQIIHRDIKPQNIFIDQDYVKIGDFGCSVQTNSKRNTIVGCLAYISPQQLNSQQYDDKIDMWSVGVLCYELLTGKAPFEEDIKKIARNQKQALFSELKFPENVKISPQAQSFTRNLLSLEPDNRMSVIKALKHPFIVKSIHHKQNLQNKIQKQNKQNIWAQQIRLLLVDQE